MALPQVTLRQLVEAGVHFGATENKLLKTMV
jgi:ribosomal protein S2